MTVRKGQPVSGFGDYLERNSSPSWKNVESEICGQFGSHSSMIKTARALVGIWQKWEESIAVLADVGSRKGGLFLPIQEMRPSDACAVG